MIVPADPVLSRFRIALTYFWRHDRWPCFDHPQTFTELVQRRKLKDRDARLPVLSDKVRVKRHVAQTLGDEWVIPTYWSGETLPMQAEWPSPYVVKSRHGCDQNIFVHSPDVDFAGVRKAAHRWLRSGYGYWLDEWLYSQVPAGILVEPFIGRAQRLPLDYKIYVFGGRAEFIQVHLDRGGRHRWIIFDRDWRRVSAQTSDADPIPPRSLTVMLDAAEALGRDFDFVRVDLYDVDTGPKFGEMTFYPGSGLDPFRPVALDGQMGALWRQAQSSMPVSPPQLTPVGAMLPAIA